MRWQTPRGSCCVHIGNKVNKGSDARSPLSLFHALFRAPVGPVKISFVMRCSSNATGTTEKEYDKPAIATCLRCFGAAWEGFTVSWLLGMTVDEGAIDEELMKHPGAAESS